MSNGGNSAPGLQPLISGPQFAEGQRFLCRRRRRDRKRGVPAINSRYASLLVPDSPVRDYIREAESRWMDIQVVLPGTSQPGALHRTSGRSKHPWS